MLINLLQGRSCFGDLLHLPHERVAARFMEVSDAKQKMVAGSFNDHPVAGGISVVPGSGFRFVALYLFLILK
jgi:hypothetical protein